MSQIMVLSIGTATTLDLRPTLPSGVAPGGRFEVDPAGPLLPAGVQLDPLGVLTLLASAQPTAVDGVIFAYNEP